MISLAGLILLQATQISGFTRMEDAFENHCKIFSDGRVTGIHLQGLTESGTWASRSSIATRITDSERDELTSLLKAAEKGPYSDSPAACDTGTLVIQGQLERKYFVTIMESRDCEPSRINLSPAAKKIKDRVHELCQLVP